MGRPRKEPGKLARPRDARRHVESDATWPWVVLEGGPAPAPRLAGARRLLPATRAWWRVWVERGTVAGFIETDWLRLQMVALLVDFFYRAKEPRVAKRLMSEIRLNEAKLGGTVFDRLAALKRQEGS
jgi:hypothetical protein